MADTGMFAVSRFDPVEETGPELDRLCGGRGAVAFTTPRPDRAMQDRP